MTRNSLAITSAVVIALMIAVAVAVGFSTPAELQLPTHWGIDGSPDQYSGKWAALLMPIALAGGVSLLLYFIPALEPRQQGLERSQGLFAACWVGMLLIGCTIELSVVSAALGWGLDASGLILGGLGILFILVGNQLGKSRSMFLIGIRTPWTLSSEEVWIKTHRLAGKLMVAGGMLLVVTALLPLSSATRAGISAGVLAIAVGAPLIYSFALWRREPRKDASES